MQQSRRNIMAGKTVKIRSSDGGEFDCHLAAPQAADKVPAIVLTCAVHGVDADIVQIAEEFAAAGYIAAAPDLFWRTVPGPLGHDDKRAQERSQPRLEKIKTGERDLMDTHAFLRTLPQFNGEAAVMGFCYGGPYAIIAPKRLGYAAGLSCHALRCSTILANSTASPLRSASCGATRITVPRPRCSTRTARCRRG
jgi:carboxymethylenebutenolidase